MEKGVRGVARPEPWQTAEHGGSRQAHVISGPKVLAALLKKHRRPLMIIGNLGSQAREEAEEVIRTVVFLAERSKIPVVTSGNAVRSCIMLGVTPSATIPATTCAGRLADPAWHGVDGRGPHDLVLIVGLPYGMEWTILSGLKNGAPGLVTLALDRYYHPQATWSFQNISHGEWVGLMREATNLFREG